MGLRWWFAQGLETKTSSFHGVEEEGELESVGELCVAGKRKREKEVEKWKREGKIRMLKGWR